MNILHKELPMKKPSKDAPLPEKLAYVAYLEEKQHISRVKIFVKAGAIVTTAESIDYVIDVMERATETFAQIDQIPLSTMGASRV